MSKALKWILGILAVLVVVAVVVGVGFLVVSHWGGSYWMRGARSFQPYDDGRVRPWKDAPQYEMPMHPGWEMPYSRFGGFYVLRIVAGGLLCLGVLALIGLGLVALVRGLNHPAQPAEKLVTPPAPDLVCSNCGRPVQDDWSHCPYCGNLLAGQPEM